MLECDSHNLLEFFSPGADGVRGDVPDVEVEKSCNEILQRNRKASTNQLFNEIL